jgi:ubiquinone/menaquinone biosynthesis C-methylase UbiE
VTPVRYTDGTYLQKNPTWHVEHAAWKARHILQMLKRNDLAPKTIAEVGCGAGEILRQLHDAMDKDVRFAGYDISPQAYLLSRPRATDRLQFKLLDFTQEPEVVVDLVLLIDVVEHVEDYYHFLRALKPRGRFHLLHIPLELSLQSVLRKNFFQTVHMSAGHLHYFSRETALQLLADVNYEVLDYVYTGGAIDFAPTSFKMALAWLPRKLLFGLNQELAARLLGGFSLLVLAR